MNEADTTVTAASLKGYIPYKISRLDNTYMVDWCRLGENRFTEPFFEQTIGRCLSHPDQRSLLARTPLALIEDYPKHLSGLYPSGFIFHMSRCGSTLVSRMLASLPKTVVISEAPPIDVVLRLRYQDPRLTEEERVLLIQQLIQALCQKRTGLETCSVIKFDAWSISELPMIERAFPGVPWIFIYRDPVEVLVSHFRKRGMHMVPGLLEPALFGMEPDEIHEMPHEEYCARVLRSICSTALQNCRAPHTQLIHYRQLPEAGWTLVPRLFGIELAPEEETALRSMAAFHAKSPGLYFRDDSEEKRASASETLRKEAARWVMPAYHELESLRNAGQPALSDPA